MREKVSASLPKGSASIRWVTVDLEAFRDFGTLDYISAMTYARFLIPRIFPDTVSRVLYLDADILVLNDLSELWETNLEGAVLGAVLDGLDPQLKSDRPGLEEIPRVCSYFNAGVLLIDLQRWRKEGVSERALAYLRKHPLSPYADQDALNVVCDARWKQLDRRWNFQEHYRKRLAGTPPAERPGIVHFVTSSKPWKVTSLSVNAAFYNSFRSRTGFARSRRDAVWEVLQGVWYRLRREMNRYLAYIRPSPPVSGYSRASGDEAGKKPGRGATQALGNQPVSSPLGTD